MPDSTLAIIEPGKPVKVGDTALPDEATVAYHEKGQPVVIVTTGVVGDRLVATRIELVMPGGGAIPAGALRAVHVPEILNAVARDAALAWRFRPGAPPVLGDEYAGLLKRTNSRRRISPDLLQEVAEVARRNPEQPTREVSRQLHTSHRNATRWIAAARTSGYLNEEEGK